MHPHVSAFSHPPMPVFTNAQTPCSDHDLPMAARVPLSAWLCTLLAVYALVMAGARARRGGVMAGSRWTTRLIPPQVAGASSQVTAPVCCACHRYVTSEAPYA